MTRGSYRGEDRNRVFDGTGANYRRAFDAPGRSHSAVLWLLMLALALAACVGGTEPSAAVQSPTTTATPATPSPQADPTPTTLSVDARPGAFAIVPADSAARFFIRERLGNSPHRGGGEAKGGGGPD